MMTGRKFSTTVLLAAVLGLILWVVPAWGTLELTIVYSNNINGYVQPCPT